MLVNRLGKSPIIAKAYCTTHKWDSNTWQIGDKTLLITGCSEDWKFVNHYIVEMENIKVNLKRNISKSIFSQ